MSCLYTDGLEVESRTVFCLGRFRNVPHSKLRSDNVKCKILDNWFHHLHNLVPSFAAHISKTGLQVESLMERETLLREIIFGLSMLSKRWRILVVQAFYCFSAMTVTSWKSLLLSWTSRYFIRWHLNTKTLKLRYSSQTMCAALMGGIRPSLIWCNCTHWVNLVQWPCK